MTKEELWQTVLADLELKLSKASFTTWFKNTFISSWDKKKEEVVIAVPNAFTQAWLEKKYHKIILNSLKEATDNKIKKVCYKVQLKKEKIKLEDIFSKKEKREFKTPTVSKEKVNKFGLNPRYTFKNFVVGEGNELAQAACLGVVKNLGKKYNPLFIYGGVGLGKTHLIQAIGNEVVKKYPSKRVLYLSAENFTNEYVEAIRTGKINNFKANYRNIDVLLIDDIQFISGKERTQEEFFHTFNELHQRERQIVLTSDRPPQAIPALEERLKSRFQMGMIVDIAPPKLETRIAILKAKLKERDYELNDEIVQYIAANIQTNVRELEGALNRIIAYHEFYDVKPTLETAKNVLSALIAKAEKKSVTPKQVIEAVANYYGLKRDDLTLSKNRRKKVALPRQVAMYLLRTELDASYPSIGEEFGGRDHTTAIHAFRKIKRMVEQEGKVKEDIDLIKERIYNK